MTLADLLSPQTSRRNLAIAGGVALLHVAILWALTQGALPRVAQALVAPAVMTAELLSPSPRVEPVARPAPPRAQPAERVKPTPPVRHAEMPRPSVAPAPAPVPAPAAAPAPAAPTAAAAPNAPTATSAAPAAKPAPAAAPAPEAAPARVELPSTNADYLNNPKPTYPPASRRMGEQGKVVVRVFISADGAAQNAEIRQSSGFERLDKAALETVLKWRYVPGKRAGVPEAMWFNVPINFVLE